MNGVPSAASGSFTPDTSWTPPNWLARVVRVAKKMSSCAPTDDRKSVRPSADGAGPNESSPPFRPRPATSSGSPKAPLEQGHGSHGGSVGPVPGPAPESSPAAP